MLGVTIGLKLKLLLERISEASQFCKIVPSSVAKKEI